VDYTDVGCVFADLKSFVVLIKEISGVGDMIVLVFIFPLKELDVQSAVHGNCFVPLHRILIIKVIINKINLFILEESHKILQIC
jgi:hypothetical protein